VNIFAQDGGNRVVSGLKIMALAFPKENHETIFKIFQPA